MKRKSSTPKFLELPFRPFHHRSVNYSQGFYRQAFKDILKWVRKSTGLIRQQGTRVPVSTIYNFLFAEKSTVAKDLLSLAKMLRRWLTTPLFIILLILALIFWPSHRRTIYADPISPAPKITRISLVKPLEQTKLVPQEKVAPIVVAPPPVAPASSGGCVSGVTSSNYALNQLIQHESGGRSCATNAGGCFGLLQACPGAPLKAACGGSVDCQLNWFATYKLGGYGSWENAWAMWQSRYPHWW